MNWSVWLAANNRGVNASNALHACSKWVRTRAARSRTMPLLRRTTGPETAVKRVAPGPGSAEPTSAGPCPLARAGSRPPDSHAGRAVDGLAEQVGVPVVARVLLHEVLPHPSH